MMKKSIVPLCALLILFFQNCQAPRFSPDYSSTTLSASVGGSTIFYTNQKNVNIEVNLDSQFMNQMRASIYENMDDRNIPWGAVLKNVVVELQDEYAADGSKDGLKKVYIEARDSKTNKRIYTSVDIFLDTQAPSLTGSGLLSLGTQGIIYSKGTVVNLQWTGIDKLAPTGVSSGFDENAGFRWGIASSGDCSESSLTQKSEWSAPRTTISVPWPSNDPLTAFYFCIYGKDKAGNIGTLLSQPMTSLWQVIAGDNNQGNGGTVTAKSVRFGYPTTLAVDSKNNLFVSDAYMNVIRRISPDGIISSFAGTGVNAPSTAGNTLVSNIAGLSDLAVDSKDRIYVVTGGGIWRIDQAADSTQVNSFYKWTNAISGQIHIAIDRKTDTMYLSNWTTSRSTESASYIYKISISEIDKAFPTVSNRPGIAAFKQYIYAGNGTGLASTTKYNDANPVLATESVDYPTAIAVGNSGEIYYADTSDGAGFPFGHQQIRMLKKDAKGVLQNYLITTAVTWIHMIQLIQNSTEKYLLVGTDGMGLRKVDLSSDVFPLKSSSVTAVDPYPSSETLHPYRVGGVINMGDKIVMAESNNSRLTVLKNDLSLSINYGRPVYNATDTVATEAMINNPDGLAQSLSGDIYITEPLSHIVRKIDPLGKISLVAGTPGKAATTADNTTYSFSQFTYSGLSFTIGFRFGLLYDASTNSLLMMDGGVARIRKLDLNQNIVTTYGPSVARGTTDSDGWYLYSMAMSPTVSANRDLIAYRSNPYYPNVGALVKNYSGANPISSVVLAGTGEVGSVSTGGMATSSALPLGATASAVDSKGNYYFSAGGTFKIDAKTKLISKINSTGAAGLQLFEDANGTHLFMGLTSGLQYTKIATDGTISTMNLCLPGTFLNRAIQVIASNDGNLLIADSKNDRILKYLIRDGSKNLKVFDSSCKY